MKKLRIVALFAAVLLLFAACQPSNGGIPKGEELGRDYYKITMNDNYQVNDTLACVPENTPAKVVILIGQSNATGCSLTSYLKTGVGEEMVHQLQRSRYDRKRRIR